jgi:GH43 family beta-xylosidase
MKLYVIPLFLFLLQPTHAQEKTTEIQVDSIKLTDIKMRDMCILADPQSKTYFMIGSARGNRVRAYTSKDLYNWYGPQIIYTAPDDLWGDIKIYGIWAPEMHIYQGKYYLFLTFNTRNNFVEQWRDWLPRVTRGSQVLVADSPTGPFKSFDNRSTLPTDMMTLDGTLWVENEIPYMVYCHEWVQIKDGTIEYIRLSDDLSETTGEPMHILNGSDAAWSLVMDKYYGYITDGPYLYTSKSGKLFMIWSSVSHTNYTVGLAISESGKLAGPWRQQDTPLFRDDGGHGMLFKTFDGRLMMVLHAPNNRQAQPRIFEMEDSGETLAVLKEFTGGNPKIARKPLYRDPFFDGAADPVVLWNREEKRWFMFYTNRRANLKDPDGVTWVHGTRIGIAESLDGGASWQYRATCDIPIKMKDDTHWAPEVIWHEGTYHMYLTYVPGIFKDWNHPREIVHLTSKDMIRWQYESTLPLANKKVIDACVFQLADGSWRMWYNNEKDSKSIYFADSKDLYTWEDKGKAVGDQSGEGPKVFRWKNTYWMVTDVWQGLALYKSDYLTYWKRVPGNLLESPGIGQDDQAKGQHPDVVVNGDKAYLFYFTHPGRSESGEKKDMRRSSIQVVELNYIDGRIICNRDAATYIDLKPPNR